MEMQLSNEITWAIQACTFKFGVLAGLGAWKFIMAMILGGVNTQLQRWMEQAIPEDQAWMRTRVMDKWWYRLIYYLINLLVSVKLPLTARKAPADTTIQ